MLDQRAAPATRRPLRVWWRQYTVDVVEATDAESDAYRAVTPPGVATWRVGVVLVTVAATLTFMEFLGDKFEPQWLITLLDSVGFEGAADRLSEALTTSERASLNRWVFWAIVQMVGYVVVPMIVIKGILRARITDFGLRRPHRSDVPVYLIMFALLLPAVVLVSFTGPFQGKYPFYSPPVDEGLWPTMGVWWPLYAAQFVALEFFFRGFIVHGLKGRLGFAAVLVMIVPYNMIHFNKPLLEALGAIAGGLALGTLSLKTRSIWLGAALHIAVAGTMDVLALTHAGRLF